MGVARTKAKRIPSPQQKVADLPQFCDFTCKHADFAPAEAIGACRREQAVYCSLFKKYNNKHNKCLGREL